MKKLAAIAVFAIVSLLMPALPAAGCEPRCGSGDLSDAGLLARTRSQMTELGRGYPGGAPPYDCSEEDSLFIPRDGDGNEIGGDGNDTVDHQGWMRWVPDFANDPTPGGPVNPNEWYRQVCYIPGPPSQTLPGASWRRFEAVTPENLARVAIDDMLAAIPQHTIETSPEVRGLVRVDTWFWIDGEMLEPVTATASIPFMTVVATAEPGRVQFDFGDGTSGECAGSGTPWSEGATSDCTHSYEVAGHYEVTATLEWTGSYTVNGGAPVAIDEVATRTATLSLPVDHAVAINTPTGG